MEVEDEELAASDPELAQEAKYREVSDCMFSFDTWAERAVMTEQDNWCCCDAGCWAWTQQAAIEEALVFSSFAETVFKSEEAETDDEEEQEVLVVFPLQWNVLPMIWLSFELLAIVLLLSVLPITLVEVAAAHIFLILILFVGGGFGDLGNSKTVAKRAPPVEADKVKLFSYSGLTGQADFTVTSEHPDDDVTTGIVCELLEWQMVVMIADDDKEEEEEQESIGVDAPVGRCEVCIDWEPIGPIKWCKWEQSLLVRLLESDAFKWVTDVSKPVGVGRLLSSPWGSFRTLDCKIACSSMLSSSFELLREAKDMLNLDCKNSDEWFDGFSGGFSDWIIS